MGGCPTILLCCDRLQTPAQFLLDLATNTILEQPPVRTITRTMAFKRALRTEDVADLQFETGRHIPIAFANWDGLGGEEGGRHSFTGWYWLRLEPESNMARLYGIPTGSGLLAGLAFLVAVRRQRRKFVQ